MFWQISVFKGAINICCSFLSNSFPLFQVNLQYIPCSICSSVCQPPADFLFYAVLQHNEGQWQVRGCHHDRQNIRFWLECVSAGKHPGKHDGWKSFTAAWWYVKNHASPVLIDFVVEPTDSYFPGNIKWHKEKWLFTSSSQAWNQDLVHQLFALNHRIHENHAVSIIFVCIKFCEFVKKH